MLQAGGLERDPHRLPLQAAGHCLHSFSSRVQWSLTSTSQFAYNSCVISFFLMVSLDGAKVTLLLRGVGSGPEDKQQVLLLTLLIKFLYIIFFPKVGPLLWHRMFVRVTVEKRNQMLIYAFFQQVRSYWRHDLWAFCHLISQTLRSPSGPTVCYRSQTYFTHSFSVAFAFIYFQILLGKNGRGNPFVFYII